MPAHRGETMEDGDEFPWRWSGTSSVSSRAVVLSPDRLKINFHPNTSNTCVAVRGERPLQKHMEHYFEVEMSGPFFGSARMVGIGTLEARLQNSRHDFSPLIGRDGSSWGFNYNGNVHHEGVGKEYYSELDPHKLDRLRVGVYYDSYYGNLAFYINGEGPGIAYEKIPTILEPFPMICSSGGKTSMQLIACWSSLVSLKALCRGTIRLYIRKSQDIQDLPLPAHLKAYIEFKDYKEHKDYLERNPSLFQESNV